MMTFYPILIGLILISNYEIVNSLTCKNKKGEPVDYWVAYKPPKHTGYFYISSEAIPILKVGEYKMGTDPTNSLTVEGWQHSTDAIESHESIVYQTFKELYENNKKHNGDKNKENYYAMFSDKKPQDIPSQTLASSVPLRKKLSAKFKKFGAPKGVIAWDNSNGNGLWVMSSISSFGPFSKGNYLWGEASHSSSSKPSMFKLFSRKSSPSIRDNGHLTMCLSTTGPKTKIVLEHLITMNVQVYDKNTAEADTFLNEATESANKFRLRNNEKRFTNLATLENKGFQIYRKKANSFGNVYDKSINKSLNFKSYSSQPKSKIRSLFGKLKKRVFSNTIHDISEIKISDQTWSSQDDESNWAVSRDGKIFCFSDLGRHADFTDAGAMVCLDQIVLHDEFFKSAIVKTI